MAKVLQKLSSFYVDNGVYKIESVIVPKRVYIGSGIDIQKRWWVHLCHLRKNTHHSVKLQRHYNKYGESDLQFSTLLRCNKEDLITTEQFYLDIYNPYFNICKTAGSQMGRTWKIPIEKRIKSKYKGVPRSEEVKEKIRQSNIGKKMSLETRKKMSIAARNKPPISKETRQKLKDNSSHWNKGIKHTEERKRRMSELRKGCKPPFQSIPENMVLTIKEAIKNKKDKTLKRISEEFNISYCVIRDISCGKSYKRNAV